MNKYLCILYIITIFIFTSCVEAEFEYFDNCTYYNNEFYCKTKTHEDLKDNNEINKNLEDNSVNITEIIIPSGKVKPNNEEVNIESKKDFYFSNIEESENHVQIEIPYIIYNDVKYLDYYGLISFSINNTDKTFSIILYDIDVNIDDLMRYPFEIKSEYEIINNTFIKCSQDGISCISIYSCITDLYAKYSKVNFIYNNITYSYPYCNRNIITIEISINKEVSDEINNLYDKFVYPELSLSKIIYKNNQLELVYSIDGDFLFST